LTPNAPGGAKFTSHTGAQWLSSNSSGGGEFLTEFRGTMYFRPASVPTTS